MKMMWKARKMKMLQRRKRRLGNIEREKQLLVGIVATTDQKLHFILLRPWRVGSSVCATQECRCDR